MSSEPLPTGPDPKAITRYILETWPETDMVGIEGANFFSLDAEKHFPNFATIVWNDDSILNPSDTTYRDVALPLLAEAHDRLAAVRARHRSTSTTA